MKKLLPFFAIILASAFLANTELGIFYTIVWHGWGGFGGVSMEYTESGKVGISILFFVIPCAVIVALVAAVFMCIKGKFKLKELLTGLVCMVVGFAVGFFLTRYTSAQQNVGCLLTAFLIEKFEWMQYPIP